MADFLYSWQCYENIYITFQSAYKYALHPFEFRKYEKYLKEIQSGKVLEYGCGAAPIVTSMIKNKQNQYDFTVADIRNFTYHYAKFRLKQHNVNFIDIVPNVNPQLDDDYSIIFLMTVLEHLPNSYEIIELLFSSLKKGAYLVFDYILSEGNGLDTMEGVKQRRSVLEYIERNSELVAGEIRYDTSMGTTVVRKK